MKLYVEELRAVLRRGQQAGFVFAENAITITRDYPVHRIPQYFWKNTAGARQAPDTTESFDHVEDCIRAHQHTLSRLAMINYHVKRIEVVRVCPMSLKERPGKVALQRRKTKPVVNVSLQNKLYEPITESADPIVKNYRMGFRNRHNTSDRGM